MSAFLIDHADIIVTMDEKTGDVRNGYLIITEGRIEEIGTGPPPKRTFSQILDASGCLIMPGLINTHHHFYQTLTRAYPAAVDSCLFPWLKALYPVWAGITATSVELGTKVAMAELMLSGCTTTVDHHYVFPETTIPELIDVQVAAAREMGMRFIATRGSMSRGKSEGGLPPDGVVQKEDVILRDSERTIDDFHDPDQFGMVQIALAPCSPFSVSPRLMKQTAELAASKDVRLHTHLAETRDELDYCRRYYGCSTVELLARTGWLTERTWLAHGIHFSDKEIELLGKHGVGIAHCPTSNMRLASGIAPVLALRDAGCPVGLAVDGSASNDSSNMIMEVRQSLLLGRLGAGAEAYSTRLALELATTGSAAVVGREQALGRLRSGFAADIAIFDNTDIGHSGAIDPVAGLVLCAPGTVKHLIINGDIVVENSVLQDLDMTGLLAAHQEEARRLTHRITKAG